jgi:HK97 family phage major capsid protein
MSNHPQIERLRARRADLMQRGRENANGAAAQNRALTPREQADHETIIAEIDEIDGRIDELETRERRDRASEATMAHYGRGGYSSPDSEDVRAFMRGESSREMSVSFTGVEKRATLSKLFSTTGAATVPTSFREQLYAHLINTAALAPATTTLNTDGGEAIQVPKTAAHSTNAAIVSETSTIPTNEPSFGQVTLSSYKYGILISVSRELIDDNGVDLEGYLAKQAGQALGNGFGADIVVGNGSAKPRGITIDSTLGRTATTSGAISDVDVQELYSSVIPAYRANASWLVNDAVWSKIRQLKDLQGRYLVGDLASGASPTLLGRPVIFDHNMASVITAGAKTAVFGDFSSYFTRIAGGVRFERSDDFAFSSDLVTFRALLRADGALVDTTGAVKHLLQP